MTVVAAGELQSTNVDRQLITCVEWQWEHHDIDASVVLSSVEIFWTTACCSPLSVAFGAKKDYDVCLCRVLRKTLASWLASPILLKQSCVD